MSGMFIKKTSPKLFFIGLAAVVLIIVICLIVFIPKSTEVKYDIIYDGVSGNALIYRNETFVDLKDYEKLYFKEIIEGQYVTEGTPVVSAYKKGYIKNTFDKLTETERNIVNYQNQSIINDFDDKKLQQYDFEIEVTIGKMSLQNGGYIELYRSLCNLMKERADYIRTQYNTDTDTYLQNLYADEESLIQSLSAWCDVVSAQNNGFIGFYCDGDEQYLNAENAMTMSIDDIEDSLKKDRKDTVIGFKLVNDEKWYVAVKVNSVENFLVGSTYPLYLSNEKTAEAGTLERIIDENKGKVLVFSISDNVEKYLDIRACSIFIGQRMEGYSVKNGYVNNGSVKIKTNKTKENVSVNVIYQDKDITLFEVNEKISLGQKVYK